MLHVHVYCLVYNNLRNHYSIFPPKILMAMIDLEKPQKVSLVLPVGVDPVQHSEDEQGKREIEKMIMSRLVEPCLDRLQESLKQNRYLYVQ